MFRRFFSKTRADRAAHLRFLKSLDEVRRGDFTILDQLAREVHENIRKQAASNQPLSPERAQLLRAKLALLEELEDREGNPRSNWSLALPLSEFWGKLSARFNSQSRASLARLIEQTSPGAGLLSGWLAPVGIGVTVAVATVAVFTNPTQVAKAGTVAAFITHATSEAASGQAASASRSAQTVGGSRDTANGDAAQAKGVSASVNLPNAAGHSGGAKLDPPLKLEPRRIVISRQYGVRVGEYFSFSEDDATTITCSPKTEKLCDTYDNLPKPEAWSNGAMCWEITDERGTASFCVRPN